MGSDFFSSVNFFFFSFFLLILTDVSFCSGSGTNFLVGAIAELGRASTNWLNFASEIFFGDILSNFLAKS
ncbi:MAG: hypothetical protein EBX20_09110 [Rhodobacterales bacterium]|nr:hypothetical protein [Rhodobacterales bacterium]